MDIRARLRDAELPSRVARLGFREPDRAAVLAAAAEVADREADIAWIADAVHEIVSRIGDFRPWYPGGQWNGGPGLLPMLALVVTAPEVAAYHAGRGISAEVSEATLSDLGQQVWVHRLTSGEFGLHTQGWLTRAWSGALYWLGRLQFEIHRAGDEWLLSVHIPRTGPLSPASVDDAYAAATAFFAEHFPDHPTRDFYCESWLLDPQLSRLVPESNLAHFQRRWTISGVGRPGDDDVMFFVFNRRGPVDHASLPRDTALRRAIIEGWADGRHWTVTQGRVPQASGVRR